MLKEFKDFIMRGNVLDLAVAVVIGAAFGKIVTSFVEDILMPPIGLALGGVDFSNLFVNLSGKDYPSVAAAKAAGAATLNYGIFLQHFEFSDHCVRDFLAYQTDQPDAAAPSGPGGGANDEGLPILLI